MKKSTSGIDVGTYSVPVKTVHHNTAQEVIVTTEDKVELCLMKHKDALASRSAWLIPFGMFVSLFATVAATSNFRPLFGLSESDVKAIIYVSWIATALWTIAALTKVGRKPTISDIIRQLKAQTKGIQSVEEIYAIGAEAISRIRSRE